MERKNAWKAYSDEQITELEEVNKSYREFLTVGKTERECVKEIIKQAEATGYQSLQSFMEQGRALQKGDKIYAVCMNKSVAMFQIGEQPLEQGMNILGAHIDSPRLDVKQNPLYEDSDMAYLDTHYYGGIKKYQWVTLPLAIHGVVVKKNAETVDICIGEKEDDPVFCVTDLLIHLAGTQMEKKAAKVIEGEKLDLLIGSMPLKDEEKDAVKANVLKLLQDQYGMEEEDFISAELEIVPAGAARELGVDRSMIMSYGQDDRVCAYTSLAAMLEAKDLVKTACCLLVDKEEIGSVGATGMQSHFFENVVAELINLEGTYSELNAAYDPLFADVFEKKNASYLGRGVVFSKFTGSRGKSGSNDANAEYLAELRNIMDNANVAYQTAELGKVDIGGGGTIIYFVPVWHAGYRQRCCGVKYACTLGDYQQSRCV